MAVESTHSLISDRLVLVREMMALVLMAIESNYG
jgi:hypothetical protein